ncbi:MAG: universal stress protein [Phormidesmis sp.]
MLNKLLVAIDESAASDWAFETALELAEALKAELILVHALDIFASSSPRSPFLLVDADLSELDKKVQKDYELKMAEFVGRYDALLKEKQAEAKAAGVTAQCIQPHGRPGPAICQAASDHNVDLMVVGNRDRSTLKELVPGSVSNYIVHHAPCSVTIVHSDSQSMAPEQPSELSLASMV